MASNRTVRLSDEVLTIVHAFGDQGRKDGIRELAGRVRRLEDALEWFADAGHYEGTYRHGAGFVDAVGLTHARAALLGMDPDDADAVGEAWRAQRESHPISNIHDTKGLNK